VGYNSSVDEAFAQATKILKLRCPLEGEVIQGETWADTH